MRHRLSQHLGCFLQDFSALFFSPLCSSFCRSFSTPVTHHTVATCSCMFSTLLSLPSTSSLSSSRISSLRSLFALSCPSSSITPLFSFVLHLLLLPHTYPTRAEDNARHAAPLTQCAAHVVMTKEARGKVAWESTIFVYRCMKSVSRICFIVSVFHSPFLFPILFPLLSSLLSADLWPIKYLVLSLFHHLLLSLLNFSSITMYSYLEPVVLLSSAVLHSLLHLLSLFSPQLSDVIYHILLFC